MLDKLYPALRHVFFMVAPVILGWAATDLVPVVREWQPLPGYLFGALVTALIAYFTPLTRQYGVGAPAPVVDIGESETTAGATQRNTYDGDGTLL